jgi:outer membrane protein OmpA-like peptidoglycan-associated protein/tetratricopeptide (TPR) repeat protein
LLQQHTAALVEQPLTLVYKALARPLDFVIFENHTAQIMVDAQKIGWILLLSTWTLLAAAQDYTSMKNASSKLKEAYRKAYSYQGQRDFAAAEKAYKKLLKKAPNFVEAHLQLGGLYQGTARPDLAHASFKKAAEIAPDYNPKVYLALGNLAMQKEDYAEAAARFEKFLSYENNHPNLVKIAMKKLGDARFRPQALANPVPFEPKNLGTAINTKGREYFPSITVEDELVYTVQLEAGQRGQEDLYGSRYVDGAWQQGRALPNINTAENEGAQSISADGTLLVFTVCNRPGDFGSCDLYYARKINGRWTAPQNMGAPINTGNWESQPSIGPNAETLYFVRGGARGQGDKNIYQAQLQTDGTWGTPTPLETLNTPYNEGSPSIHPDGKTLYFSSQGHPGMGGFDLFVARLQADGSWSAPINLGYPINTSEQEEALAVNRQGTLAYLASNREGGQGSMDLYSFELPTLVRPTPITYVKGRVLHAHTQAPLSANVELVDLNTQQVITRLRTPKDGQFVVCLPVGEYALRAQKQGYLFFSARYDLRLPTSLEQPYPLEARLQPVVEKTDENTPKNEPIVLENVFFATASAKLEDRSKAELEELKKLLHLYPTMRILLSGHTDNVGSPEDNQALSDARARAVREYLIQAGIAANRLESRGFGETQPRYTNETEAGRAGNRRTTFEVLPPK